VKTVQMGLLVVLAGAVLLMVSSGFVTGATAAASASGGGLSTASTAASSSNTFNFTSPHPTWNYGNLCTTVTVGDNVSCNYSGSGHHGFAPAAIAGCGCQGSTPLTYNFSSGKDNVYTVNISNLNNQNVYLNFQGQQNTITINVTGCSGGTLNVSIKGEDTVNLIVSSSSVKVAMYIYSNHDNYRAWLSGNRDTVWTDFISAQTKLQECPAENNSATDTYWFSTTGWGDSQAIVFVSAVGPGSALNWISTGNWNSAAFENTTDFTCTWTYAPASTCHHGWTPTEVIATVRHEE
jgi:hypothetical protein